MKNVSNVYFRWDQPVDLHPTAVGEVAEFSAGNQKQFKKTINWMVVGDRSVDAEPQFIGVKNVRRNTAPSNPEWIFEGDVIGIVNGHWDEVNYLYTTYKGNGANSVPTEKGAEFAIELSKRLREQRTKYA